MAPFLLKKRESGSCFCRGHAWVLEVWKHCRRQSGATRTVQRLPHPRRTRCVITQYNSTQWPWYLL